MMATSEFGKAFAAARKAGDKTFEFNGKKYTTKTAEDVAGEKKAKDEGEQRKRSDMMRDLTKAEREMPAGTSELAKQKIAEAKAKVTREYAAAGEAPLKASGAKIQSMDTDMMRTAGRTAAKEAGERRKASSESEAKVKDKKTFGALNRTETNRAQRESAMRDDKASYKKGGSINGIAQRGLTKCKMR